jgi:hypothetical protein
MKIFSRLLLVSYENYLKKVEKSPIFFAVFSQDFAKRKKKRGAPHKYAPQI